MTVSPNVKKWGIGLATFVFICFAGIPFLVHAADAAATTDTASQNTFVPLTQLPAIKDIASSDSLPAFLNELYKILIGVGAVLAVVMIMVAGVQFMTSQGSVMSNEKAKSRIQNAILGLVLLLSPTIVFSIINPDILKLNFNASGLTPKDLSKVDTTPLSGPSQDNTTVSSDPGAEARCKAAGGTAAKDSSSAGAIRCTTPSGTCQAFSTTTITNLVSDDNQKCCNAQKGCSVKKDVKHTYCMCSAS